MGTHRSADHVSQPAGLTRATAPGKVILFGEHAVVYGRPALAAPLPQLQATAEVQDAPDGFWIDAPDIGRRYPLDQADETDPLAQAVRLTLARLGRSAPSVRLTLTSSIPPASGLGSGAAVCTAIVRALSAHLGPPLPPAEVAAIVFETEKLLHGTPSGIDNNVVAYGQPIYFVRGRAPEPFQAGRTFRLLIGDTGMASPTRVTVGDVRAAWERNQPRYEKLFDTIGEVARRAREVIEFDGPAELGRLMDRNHALLGEMGVSSPELEALVWAARGAGALGAKLSGAGRGGNMLALVSPGDEAVVSMALTEAGARRVLAATLSGAAS